MAQGVSDRFMERLRFWYHDFKQESWISNVFAADLDELIDNAFNASASLIYSLQSVKRLSYSSTLNLVSNILSIPWDAWGLWQQFKEFFAEYQKAKDVEQETAKNTSINAGLILDFLKQLLDLMLADLQQRAQYFRRREKQIWNLLVKLDNIQNHANTILSSLAAFHAVNGSLAVGFSAFGGFGFAVSLWLYTVYYGLAAWRSARSAMDSNYLIAEKIARIKALGQVLAENKDTKLEQKQAKLEREVQILLNIQEAKNKEQLLKQYPELQAYSSTDALTPEQKKLAEQLQQKQQEKAIGNIVNFIAWGAMAVGATLMACSMFFPPLCLPGSIIFAGGAMVAFAKFQIVAITNFVTNKYGKTVMVQKFEQRLIREDDCEATLKDTEPKASKQALNEAWIKRKALEDALGANYQALKLTQDEEQDIIARHYRNLAADKIRSNCEQVKTRTMNTILPFCKVLLGQSVTFQSLPSLIPGIQSSN